MLGYLSPRSWSFARLWLMTINLFLWMNLSVVTGAESEWVTDGTQAIRTAAISSDGRLMVYLRDEGKKSSAFLRFVRDKGAGVRIQGLPDRIHSLAFSPDGSKIVFSAQQQDQSKLFIKGLKDKNAAEQITFGAGSDFHPRFSPDGQSVCFDSDREGNFEIHLLDLNSRDVRRITSWKQPDFAPAMSPDGNWIAYTSARGSSFQIFLQNLRVPNSMPLQLTQDEAVASKPVFSEDGQYVVYESNMEGRTRIYALCLKDYSVRRLIAGDETAQAPIIASGSLYYAAEQASVFGIRAMNLRAMVDYPEVKTSLPAHVPVLNQIHSVAQTLPESPIQLVNQIKEMEQGFEGYDFDLAFLDQQKPEPSPQVAKELVEPGLPEELVANASETIAEAPLEEGEDPLYQFDSSPTKRPQDKLAQHFAIRRETLIDQTIPASGQKDVSVLSPISVILKAIPTQFGREVLNPKLVGPMGEVPCQITVHEALRRVDIIPQGPLESGSEYRLLAPDQVLIFSTAGIRKPVEANQTVAQDLPKANSMELPLRVARVFPDDRARNLKVNTPIRVRFNQKVLPESVAADSLQLFQNKQLVPGELVFADSDQELSLKPYHNLLEATVYEIRLSKDLKSTQGQPLDAATRFMFKTEHFSPFLISEFPPGVLSDAKATFEVRLNRAADPRTLNSEEFQLRGPVGPISGKVELLDRGMVLRYSPWQQLPADSELTFYFSPNLRDRDGNLLQNSRPISFSTRFGRVQARAEQPANQVVGPDFSLLKEMFAMGALKGRGVESLLNGQDNPERFRVALVLEEALGSLAMLTPSKRQELVQMAQDYSSELKNLGVDVDRLAQSVRRPRPASNSNQTRETLPQMRQGTSRQSKAEPVSDDFVGRARQI